MEDGMQVVRTLFLLIAAFLVVIALWAGWHWFSVVEQDVEFQSGELILRGTLLTPRWP